jgi:polar amino acid transport system permease protein
MAKGIMLSRALVASQRNMIPFAIAALIYWLTCLLIEFLLRRAEKKLDYYHD